jgi:hypothetical protein
MLMSKEICQQRTEQFWPTVRTQQPRSQLKALEKKNAGVPKKMRKRFKIWGPKMGTKNGPKNGPQLWPYNKDPIKTRFRGPVLGTKNGPKNGTQNRATKTKIEKTREKKGRPREPKKGPTHESLGTWKSFSSGSTPWLVPKSRLQVAAEVHTYMAPKASTCGCDHNKEKASVVT